MFYRKEDALQGHSGGSVHRGDALSTTTAATAEVTATTAAAEVTATAAAAEVIATTHVIAAAAEVIATTDVIAAAVEAVATTEVIAAAVEAVATTEVIAAAVEAVATTEVIAATVEVVATTEVIAATVEVVATTEVIATAVEAVATTEVIAATVEVVATTEVIAAAVEVVATTEVIAATVEVIATTEVIATSAVEATAVGSAYAGATEAAAPVIGHPGEGSSARTAIEAGVGVVIHVAMEPGSEVAVGAVIPEAATAPVATEESGAKVAKAVVHTAIEANGEAPVAGEPIVNACIPAPVAGGPQGTGVGRKHPGARVPEIATLAPGPVARSPYVSIAGARRLVIDRDGRRSVARGYDNRTLGRSCRQHDRSGHCRNRCRCENVPNCTSEFHGRSPFQPLLITVESGCEYGVEPKGPALHLLRPSVKLDTKRRLYVVPSGGSLREFCKGPGNGDLLC